MESNALTRRGEPCHGCGRRHRLSDLFVCVRCDEWFCFACMKMEATYFRTCQDCGRLNVEDGKKQDYQHWGTAEEVG